MAWNIFLLFSLPFSLSLPWYGYPNIPLQPVELTQLVMTTITVSVGENLCASLSLQGQRFYSRRHATEVVNYIGSIQHKPILMSVIHNWNNFTNLMIDWNQRACSSKDIIQRETDTSRGLYFLFHEALERNHSIIYEMITDDSYGKCITFSNYQFFQPNSSSFLFLSFPALANQNSTNHTATFQQSTGYLLEYGMSYQMNSKQFHNIFFGNSTHLYLNEAFQRLPASCRISSEVNTSTRNSLVIHIFLKFEIPILQDPEQWSSSMFKISCPFFPSQATTQTVTGHSFFSLSSTDSFSKTSIVLTACVLGLLLAFILVVVTPD